MLSYPQPSSSRDAFFSAVFKKFNGETITPTEDERKYAYKTTTDEVKFFDETTRKLFNNMFAGKITVEEGSKLLAEAGFSKFVEMYRCTHCRDLHPKSELTRSHDEYYLCQKCFDPEYLEYDEDCECSECDAHRNNNN